MRNLIKPAEGSKITDSILRNGRDESDGTRDDARDGDLVNFPDNFQRYH